MSDLEDLEELHYLLEERFKEERFKRAEGELSEYLNAAINDVKLAKSRLNALRGKIKIAVVGRGNVGKTTLLNSILGEGFAVAPTANQACTATVVEFSYGESFKIRNFPLAETGTLAISEIAPKNSEELKRELSCLVGHKEISSGQKNTSNKIKVSLPAPILKNVILIDTPGFGAAKSAGGEEDDKIIENFLKNDVSNIFWMCSIAGGGLTRKDEEYLKIPEIRQKCEDLIFSDSDGIKDSEEDKDRVRKRFSDCVKPGTRFHFVDGKQAKEALEKQDENAWAQSGLKDVCSRICALATKEGRKESLKKSLCGSLEHLSEVIQEMRERGDLNSWIFPETKLVNFLQKTEQSSIIPSEWREFLLSEKQIINK